MGVGAGLYMYVVVVRKFTFAISSPDEFLFNSLIHTYFRLLTLSQKKTNWYPLPTTPQKMLLHYLVQCKTFSSDWRQCCIPQNVGGFGNSRLWVGIGGSEKNRLWCVATGMLGKQRHSKCSKWPCTFCTDTHFQSFSPLINCIVHHAVLKFSPCRNKTLL